jgi:hypothetical protein
MAAGEGFGGEAAAGRGGGAGMRGAAAGRGGAAGSVGNFMTRRQ